MTIHDKELYYTVIQYCINGLPRSEISAKTGISTGSVSNYIKKWVESVEIQDIEGIRDLMKQVNKTGATVKECAQGHIILQLIKSVYNDEEEEEVQDKQIPDIFWSFIKDIYIPCLKLGVPPSLIPKWINDLWIFLSHPNRQDDINLSVNSQNESHKHSTSMLSNKPNPNTSDCQLNYPNSIEQLKILKEKADQHHGNKPSLSRDIKYLMENPNISFITTLSSHVNAKKKESIKLEEHIKIQQYNLEKINLQINKSQELRDYVINEEQYIMEMYDWYHGLKNALKEKLQYSHRGCA